MERYPICFGRGRGNLNFRYVAPNQWGAADPQGRKELSMGKLDRFWWCESCGHYSEVGPCKCGESTISEPSGPVGVEPLVGAREAPTRDPDAGSQPRPIGARNEVIIEPGGECSICGESRATKEQMDRHERIMHGL